MRAALDTIEATAETSARNPYRAAVESRTMGEADGGSSLAPAVRRDEITDAVARDPDRTRQHIAYVIAKAAVEQSIAELRITEDDQVTPVFRIFGPTTSPRPPRKPPNPKRFAQCLSWWRW